jgi:hypothetical protein
MPLVGEPESKIAQLAVDGCGTWLIEVLFLENQLPRLAVLVPVLEGYDNVFESRSILLILFYADNGCIETLLESAQSCR